MSEVYGSKQAMINLQATAMKQLNRYYRCAKISERKTRQIIRFFALDLTANKTVELVSMTHQSVNRIFLKIRERIDLRREIRGRIEKDNILLVASNKSKSDFIENITDALLKELIIYCEEIEKIYLNTEWKW